MTQGSCLCGQIEYEVELIPDKTFNKKPPSLGLFNISCLV